MIYSRCASGGLAAWPSRPILSSLDEQRDTVSLVCGSGPSSALSVAGGHDVLSQGRREGVPGTRGRAGEAPW